MNERFLALARRVAKQTAYRTNGYYGYSIVSPEDILQDIFVRLGKHKTDLAEVDNPEAYLRTTAKFVALAEVDRILRPKKNRATSGDYVGQVEAVEYLGHAEPNGYLEWDPERTKEHEETVERLEAAIEAILAKVGDEDRRASIRAFYVDGKKLDQAARKRKSRGEKGLDPEDIAALQVWRTWLHPELPNREPATEATPLLAVLFS